MKLPLSRWHPEVALRYLPASEWIKRANAQTVLEVGSGSLGIAPYLNQPVTGVDRDFTGPSFPLLAQVRGEATNLPFPERSFDAAVCVDVLEHLPSEARGRSVQECVRVAKKIVILGVPTKETAEAEDLYLMQYAKKRLGRTHPFFTDHVTYGLPSMEQLRKLIAQALQLNRRKATVEEYSNESLWLHRWLMKGWLTDSFVVDLFFRKMLLPFIPMLRLCNAEPTYRKFFVVKFEV